MKLIPTFILTILISISLQAQSSILIEPAQYDTTVTDLDLSPSWTSVRMSSCISNLTEADIKLDWKIEDIDTPVEWEFSVSTNDHDFVPGLYESPLEVNLDSAAVEQLFSIHCYPHEVTGCGKFTWKFYKHETDILVDSISYEIKINDTTNCGLTSVDDTSGSRVLSIRPNLVVDIFSLYNSEGYSNLQIHDAVGQLIMKIKDGETQVDISHLSPGMYWLCATNHSGELTTLEVIKQ